MRPALRSQPNRGVTLVATVLLSAIAATIALVLVRQTILLTRSESVRGDYEAAYEEALAVKGQFDRELAADPDFYYKRMFAYERPRLCDGKPVIGPADPSTTDDTQGTTWPADCPNTWTYAPAAGVVTGTDGTTYDPSTHPVRVELTPPTPNDPDLTVRILATSGQTETGLTATYRPSTAAAVTGYSAGDMRVATLDADADTQDSATVKVKGTLYAGGQIYLPTQTADLGGAQLFAEHGFVGTLPVDGHYYTTQDTSSSASATPSASPASSSSASPTGQGNNDVATVGDIRTPVPTPLSLDALRSSFPRLQRAGCPQDPTPQDTVVDGISYISSLCLTDGAQVRNTAGTLTYDTTTGAATGAKPAAYLLLFAGTAKAPTVRVYTAAATPATVGDCVVRCDLTTLAKADYDAGQHPASPPAATRSSGDLSTAPVWQPLGEFPMPATGVIATDANTYVGQCPGAIDPSADCATTAAASSVTVVAGTPSDPHDLVVAGPVSGTATASHTTHVGLVATRSLVIPYYARRPGGDLAITANLVALGYGVPAGQAVETFPATQASLSEEPGNYGGTLTITGSVAAPTLDGQMAGWRHVRLVNDPAASTAPPPHFPGFTTSWMAQATQRTSSYDVCGQASCASTW